MSCRVESYNWSSLIKVKDLLYQAYSEAFVYIKSMLEICPFFITCNFVISIQISTHLKDSCMKKRLKINVNRIKVLTHPVNDTKTKDRKAIPFVIDLG